MASFANILDELILAVPDKGEAIAVAISGTYDQTILLQEEIGSPGSGSWKTLKTFNTEDETEAYTFYSTAYKQRFRLFLELDGGGTATVTLTNASKEDLGYLSKYDRNGNLVQEFHQGGVRFPAGFTVGPPVAIVASASLTADEHAGRTVNMNLAGALTLTLPEATGTGDVYKIFVGTTATGAHKIAALTTDIIQGAVTIVTDIGGVIMRTGADADYISMSGSTTGGVKGSWVQLEDVADGVWAITGNCISTGAEADPFGAT